MESGSNAAILSDMSSTFLVVSCSILILLNGLRRTILSDSAFSWRLLSRVINPGLEVLDLFSNYPKMSSKFIQKVTLFFNGKYM